MDTGAFDLPEIKEWANAIVIYLPFIIIIDTPLKYEAVRAELLQHFIPL